jgi:GSH-dependent disulfide-bond oxidoreductase
VIDLYAWTTPNGYKALIAFEELLLPRTLHWVNLGKNEQLEPGFLAINPNNKIPAIRDPDGPGGNALTVFESGAILIYLADKTGKLLAKSGADRYTALEWVFFQNAGVGPMMGQLGHFARLAKEKVPYAIDRYTEETRRLLRVLDGRLGRVPFLASEYSIADITTFPWVRNAPMLGIELEPYPNVARWIAEIEARPAVQRGLALKP